MTNEELTDAIPNSPPDEELQAKKKKGVRWWLVTLIGVLALLLIFTLSGISGYTSGINERVGAEATYIANEAESQYALGLQDLQDGRIDRARERFEYILTLNPNYPGVHDKLAEVLILLNATATPSPVPTQVATSTPDTRESEAVESLFQQAEQQLANEDWANSIDTLLLVRKKDPGFNMIQIDGMLYIALRNLGVLKILQLGDLEGGVYDLALAERFGLLDSEAQGILSWAKLYITGASFWELDWEQAVYYFSQVAPQLPGLRDGSNLTAKERYRLALIGFADSLMLANDPCQAVEQYQLSLSIGYDATVELALNEAITACEGGKPEEVPVEQPTGDPGGGLPTPTEEPSPYP